LGRCAPRDAGAAQRGVRARRAGRARAGRWPGAAGNERPARRAADTGAAKPVAGRAPRPPGRSACDAGHRGAGGRRRGGGGRTCRARTVPDPRRRGGKRDRRARRPRRSGCAMSRTPDPLFDARQVRRAFSRASASYASASALQREVEARLLESLDLIALDTERERDWQPGRVRDVGSGPGHAAHAMRRRWPRARIVALDLALPMLREMPARAGWNPLRRPVDRVCADLRALPLADGSVDVLFSNLCLQWVADLPGAFAGFRRVLRPGGVLLCSTFGPDTLWELREAFARADDAVPHVSPFADIARFGDALMHAGFRDPVLDRDLFVRGHS